MKCPGRDRIGAENRKRALPGMRAALTVTFVTLALTAAGAALATITVGTLNDSTGVGGCSLRDAITTANGADVAGSGCPSPTADPSNTIIFSLTGTIALAGTLPAITGNLSITRPVGAPRVKIDGGNLYQVMIVRAGAVVNLHNLEISHGKRTSVFSNSGGIDNDGTLTVIDSAVFANSAPGKTILLGVSSTGRAPHSRSSTARSSATWRAWPAAVASSTSAP